MQITPSDVLKLISDIATAEMTSGTQSLCGYLALSDAHRDVEQYLGTKIEFEIKEPLPGEPS